MFGTSLSARSALLIEEKDKDGNTVTRVYDIRVQEVELEQDIFSNATGIRIRGYLMNSGSTYRDGPIDNQPEIGHQKAITDGEEEIVVAELIED